MVAVQSGGQGTAHMRCTACATGVHTGGRGGGGPPLATATD